MPQATDELRAEWPGMDTEAIRYLQDRGWYLHRDWSWSKPSREHEPAPRECSAVQYLIDEWDFDGIRSSKENYCAQWEPAGCKIGLACHCSWTGDKRPWVA